MVRLALLSLPLFTGCYRYRPLDLAAVPVGTSVDAQLSDRGSLEMTDTVGGAAVRLSGRVQQATPDRVVLALNRVTFRQGRAVTWSGEPVGVPRTYVVQLRERKLSWWRSVATGTLVATGFLYMVDRLGGNIGLFGGPLTGGGGGGPGTGSQ